MGVLVKDSSKFHYQKRKVEHRNRKWFPSYVPAWKHYLNLAKALIEPKEKHRFVLHLGSGHDSYNIRDKLRYMHFVSFDINELALRKNKNALRIVGDAESLPFKEDAFCLIMSEDVIEHLEDPQTVFSEAYRCLKKSGKFLFLAPVAFSYISIMGKVIPRATRAKLREMEEADVCPVFYRCNTPRAICKIAKKGGFKVEKLETFVGWPSYWEFSDLLHKIMVVFHKILEHLPACFHITMVGILEK